MTMRLNADTDFDPKDRENLLHLSQRSQMFRLMLEKSEPKEWAEWLRAPLEHACESGDSELVDTLLEAGADGSARGLVGRRGRTLLHAAAAGGNDNVVWSLLDHGAKPDMEVKLSGEDWPTPYTPLQVAVERGHAAAAKVLMAAGADLAHTLVVALNNGHDRLAYDLLLAGADPDEPGFRGWVLTHACRLGHERLVRALLQRGADAAPTMGHTPLHEAARGGHTNIAKVLLAAGSDANAFTWHGETPLHAAARAGSAAAIDVLVAAGADAGVRHPTLGQGRSPLHLAAEMGHTEAALALLRQHGADVNADDNADLQPLHLACMNMQTDMVDLLLKRGADETAADRNDRTPLDLLPTAERIAQDVATYAAHDGTPQEEEQERDDNRDAHKRRQFDDRDRAIRLLTRAPHDRAWRRRGVAVLCRARAETLRLQAGPRGPAVPPRGRVVGATCGRKLSRRERAGAAGARGRAACGDAGADAGDDGVGTLGLGAWLVDLQEEGIFRNIVGFL